MLWLLQPPAPSRKQQNVFPKDDSGGLQSHAVLVREEKPKDDLVHDVLSGSVARPRHLLISALFEPGDGNIREGHHAKEV